MIIQQNHTLNAGHKIAVAAQSCDDASNGNTWPQSSSARHT